MRDYYTVNLTNTAGVFSGLPKGKCRSLWPARKTYTPGRGVLRFCKQRPEGRCTKRQATTHRAFAKTPNNRTCCAIIIS